jgi:hypothetical protein
MGKHISVMRFLSAVLLLDILLIGAVSVTGTNATALLSHLLPGTFGPGMGPHMTGNHLFGAIIVFVNSLLFLVAGFLMLSSMESHALMIGSGGIARLLRSRASLAQEEIAATSFAVAEEQKTEIHRVHTGRNLVWIGAVLLLLAFPAVCFTYARADINGEPLFQDTGGAVSNAALSAEDAVVFAADQLADAVLLDVPRVFQWHLTSLQPGRHHSWLRPFVLLYHILSKLVVLASLFAVWRGGQLRAYALQVAGLENTMPMRAGFRDRLPEPALEQRAADILPVGRQQPHDMLERPLPEPPAEQSASTQTEEILLAATPSVFDTPANADHIHEAVAVPDAPALKPESEHPDVEKLAELEPEAAHSEARQPTKLLPTALPAPVPDVPVYAEPARTKENRDADAPLALHELKIPYEHIETASHDGMEEGAAPTSTAYRKTALHLTPEFDA